MSEVQPDFISKTSFEWVYQNNLQIKSDQKNMVGKQYFEEYYLSNITMEDITGMKKR